MTQKEHIILNQLSTLPNFQELISRLDLTPTNSAELQSARIANRIQGWIHEFSAPLQPRSIILEAPTSSSPMIFQPQPSIEAWLCSIFGHKPWKYPLTKAPF